MKPISIPAKLMGAAFAGVLLVATTPAKTLNAEELDSPEARQGYYLSAGLMGITSFNRDDSAEKWLGAWPGGMGSVRVGERIADWMDLGIGIQTGVGVGPDYRGLLGHIAIEAQFRPWWCRDPLFIRASAGFGFIDITRRKPGLEAILGQAGGAYGLFVGYDFFPTYKSGSGGFALTPVVGAELGIGGTLTSITAFIGLEFTFWTGLPKNQLEPT